MTSALFRPLALVSVLALAGCLGTTAPGAGPTGGATSGGGDGPVFVKDERGCLYEVLGGQRYPIVYESGRQQCTG